MEVSRTDEGGSARSTVVSKTDRLAKLAEIPLEMARISMGDAIARGIGRESYKAFGDTGLITKVVSGEKVPDYLAKLYADADARQRFALALLEGLDGVAMETTVRINQTKAG
jgi:hypothetical protein